MDALFDAPIQCDNDLPLIFEFKHAVIMPNFESPIQANKNSGLFSIKREITSPYL